MKFSTDISPFRKTLFFILGLLVAAFVVSQEVITYHCAKLVQAQEQANDTDEPQEGPTFEYTCDVMLPAASDLLKPIIPFVLHEVVRDSEEQDFPKLEVPLYDTPHYKTLFRQIISPNAP